jgi:carboxymethylenebutenolidase
MQVNSASAAMKASAPGVSSLATGVVPMIEVATLNRRAVLKATLGAGFCAAVSPVFAQAITTPATGLVAGEVRIPPAATSSPAIAPGPKATGGLRRCW